jgi:hypothetical protein
MGKACDFGCRILIQVRENGLMLLSFVGRLNEKWFQTLVVKVFAFAGWLNSFYIRISLE